MSHMITCFYCFISTHFRQLFFQLFAQLFYFPLSVTTLHHVGTFRVTRENNWATLLFQHLVTLTYLELEYGATFHCEVKKQTFNFSEIVFPNETEKHFPATTSFSFSNEFLLHKHIVLNKGKISVWDISIISIFMQILSEPVSPSLAVADSIFCPPLPNGFLGPKTKIFQRVLSAPKTYMGPSAYLGQMTNLINAPRL